MATDFEKSVDKYADSIKFICPKEIAPEKANKAYNNLISNKPKEPSNKRNPASSFSGIDSSSPGFYSDKNKKYKNLLTNPDTKEEKNIEKIRFGQHSSFSFFESYAREIIFQIFDYHPMHFFNYQIKRNEIAGGLLKKVKKRKKKNLSIPILLIIQKTKILR